MVNVSRLKNAIRRGLLASPGSREPTEEDLERGRRLDAILEGLTDAQREYVLEDLNDPEVMRPGGRRTSRLTREILASVIGIERPPIMHPAVAQVYAEHPDASPLHECEDCGLGIPAHGGIIRGGRTIPFRRYFDRCPNCGGHVRYAAYFHKHKAEETPAA